MESKNMRDILRKIENECPKVDGTKTINDSVHMLEIYSNKKYVSDVVIDAMEKLTNALRDYEGFYDVSVVPQTSRVCIKVITDKNHEDVVKRGKGL